MKKLSLIALILFIKMLLPSSSYGQGTNMYDPIYAGSFGGTSAVNYTDTRNNDPANGYGNDYGQPSDDIYYQITLTAPTQITVSTCGSNFDTYLHILASDGVTEVAYNDDDFSAHCGSYPYESYIQTTLPAGTYYVVTEGYSYNYGDITVNISTPANAAANPPPGANKDNAIDIGTMSSCNGSYTDTKNNSPANGYGNDMGQASDDIYYKFTLAAPAQVTLSTCGSGFDTYLHLLNGDGVTERAYNDDDGGVHCSGYYLESYIQTTLPAGTYYIVTEGYSTNIGNIVLNLATGGGVAASQDRNYVLTQTPSRAIADVSTLQNLAGDKTKVETSIQYFDGLGRPLQTVQRQGSPNGSDLVQPIAYDQFGREALKYLPYASTNCADGSYKPNAIAEQAVFYNPAGSTGTQQSNGIARIETPYAGINYEPSPLNRVIEQGAPGNSWQLVNSGVSGSGHTVQIAYGSNTGSTEVIKWLVNSNGNGATGTSNYDPNKLYKTTTTDENGNSSIEYKDMQGHVVCKKVPDPTNNGSYLSTNYVYDDFGNLAYVIPPIPVTTTYPTSFVETTPVFLNFIYGYHYDGRNRLVEKKIPGKGDWDYIVYNNLDQVVATQDPVQRNNNQWLFTKYDGFGRVIETGIWDNGGSAITRVTLQGQISAQTGNLWESRTPGNYYTTTSCWPNSWTTTLSINYYDDYTYPGNPYGPWDSGTLTNPTGLLTATKNPVLNPDGTYGDQLWTVNYYDDKGRVVQTSKQHYLGGHNSYNTGNYDVIKTVYNFDNTVSNSNRWHIVNNAVALTTANAYYYDHMGRKIQNYESINSQTTVLLSEVDYNEIGQIKAKHLHNVVGQNGFLQDIAYNYNERGWLTQINNPTVAPTPQQLFSLQLNYDHIQFGSLAQYNGNISEQIYNAGVSGLQHVTYNYDALNRLTDGTSSAGLSETNINYDNLGNIGGLIRFGPNAALLTYNYTGNQLQTVTNNGPTFRSYGYDPNGNATSDGMGNAMYYNMLNLPRSIPSKNLSYTYKATGEKLNKISNGVTTEYIDGIQYTGTNIDFVQTEEGKANNNGGTYTYEYTLKDHLGNNRVTFDQTNGKVGEDDYYPFGLNVHRQQNAGNKYLYNGKEIQDELNGQYDYGARFYDPVIARWTVIDPMVEFSRRWSPYNYVKNNPISNIDPTGMVDTTYRGKPLKEVEIHATTSSTTSTVVNLIIDNLPFVGSGKQLYQGIRDGNWKEATLGAVFLTVDVFTAGEGGEALKLTEKGVELSAEEALKIGAEDEIKEGAEKSLEDITYQTYTKEHPETGEVYSGRTSGKGTPEENVAARDAGHHKNADGFGPAKLDKSSKSSDAIRGREQQLIDHHGGAKSTGGTSGNAINGIGARNAKMQRYIQAAGKAFGQLPKK